jgi:AraC-like DNA-binding protein
MEMIFHYGDLYRQYSEDGSSIVQPRCFVIGQLTVPLEIQPTGVTDIFSVRFEPNGFVPFTDMPLKNFENLAVPLGEIFGKEGEELEAAMLASSDDKDRISIAERFLQSRLSNLENIDRVAKDVVDTMLGINGQLSVQELAEQLNINRKQLERRCAATIGLSPKQLAKVIRLQAALKLLANKQFTSLTSLAYEGEYYDQAHFIKDFKEFTGLTPKQFYSDNLKMSALFSSAE